MHRQIYRIGIGHIEVCHCAYCQLDDLWDAMIVARMEFRQVIRHEEACVEHLDPGNRTGFETLDEEHRMNEMDLRP